MYEYVNHPKHYKKEGKKECIDEMIDLYGVEYVAIWCKLTAYKYRYRAGLKPDNTSDQDIAKLKWYTNKYYELTDQALKKKRTGD